MGAPQIIVITLWVIDFILSVAKKGESKGVYKPAAMLCSIIITALLLNWGGFFS
jgi:hypothetical protein